MKRKVAVLLILLIMSVILAGRFWVISYINSPCPVTEETTIIIPKGLSAKKIIRLLGKSNLITHPRIFDYYIRLRYPGTQMRAGEYLFPASVTPLEAFSKIAAGDVVIRSVTIPEGLMNSQVINILNKSYGLTGDAPEKIIEGELLPETYYYSYGDSRVQIIEEMKREMISVVDKLWQGRAENLPFKSKYEALILASIVEKETGIPAERGHVASVFINRLNKRMRLQTDPTVIYAITEGKYVLDRPLQRKDLEFVSPYNTYLNYGLPPTPIANPGKASIEAVLNPPVTDSLYFVADGTGGHVFASSLLEHNNNVRKWRKINK